MNTRSSQPGAGETLGLLGQQRRAGGDDEHVVGDRLAVGEVHGVVCRLDPVDLGDSELDAVVDLRMAGPNDLGRVGQAERDEQQAGLVDVSVVAVDHCDLGGVPVGPAQPVRGQRAAGAALRGSRCDGACQRSSPDTGVRSSAQTHRHDVAELSVSSRRAGVLVFDSAPAEG